MTHRQQPVRQLINSVYYKELFSMPLCFISQQLVKLVVGAQLSWLSWVLGCCLARKTKAFGDTPKLMAAKFLQPFVKSTKTIS
jgi:hypothetical protein